MRCVIIGFVIGVALLQQQAVLPSMWWFVVGLLVAVIFVFYARRVKRLFISNHNNHNIHKNQNNHKHSNNQIRFLLSFSLEILLAILAGFCWSGMLAIWFISEELPTELQGQDIQVVGLVSNLPIRTPQGINFQFEIEEILPNSKFSSSFLKKTPKKISLAWFDNAGSSVAKVSNVTYVKNNSPQAERELKPGQRWQLTVRLKRPHGNANPQGFDYEVWLLEQGIRATGTVRTNNVAKSELEQNRLMSDFVWGWSNIIERCRYVLRERIRTALPDAPYASVIMALVVGDQREVSQTDWQIFNRTGIGHLVSISGLHITMIAALFSGLMYFLWRSSFFTQAQLPLKIPAQKVAALTGVVVAFLYVALAGFGVPAQRTLLMLLVVAVAMWTGRLTSISAILCLALGLVVLFDPWAILWPGFWLSFFAVGLLLYVSMGRSSAKKLRTKREQWLFNIQSAAHMQYAITIGLLPLTLLLFGQVSLMSPIANAVAIPLISFVVTPLALLGSVLPSSIAVYVLSAAHACMAWLAQILAYLSASSIAVWQVPSPTPLMFILAFIGTLWMLAPRGWPVRFLGLFCWLPILLQPDSRPATGAMNVTVFDVGQGSALLIETAHHRLLYDTGPAYSLESNAGTRVLLPYFQSRGIRHVDAMVISHADIDHSGGALSVLNNVHIAKTYSSLTLDNPIVSQSQQAIRCQVGQKWEWDGVHFEMLFPMPASYESSKWKNNARSCTLKISTVTKSILLAGDIEAIQEDELVNMFTEKLPATVLLAPHHGSGTSSTLPFLKIVQAELALFQVGYLNRYRHPKPEVWQRYRDLNIKTIRTDKSGAITLQFASEKDSALSVEEYRKTHQRYWYQQSN